MPPKTGYTVGQNIGHTTVRAPRGGQGSSAGSMLALRWLFPATDGPITPLSSASSRLTIGRGDHCDTILPGAEISRQHAEIVREGPLVILRDAGSKNGCYVNGRLHQEVPLALGDVVRLGEWLAIVVEIPEQEKPELQQGTIAPGLAGGPTLRAAVAPALLAAPSDLPIIIEGETGTGKEVLARAIHAASNRPGQFIAVNCAALPETLAEAELFGYRRGAFTGADRGSPGHFRSAHRGTLLFDEISDLPLTLQAKVLRVIEQHEVVPLGESQPIDVDARLVAAAQDSLERRVAENAFRADLFARLDGVTVRLPPLRERIEDVPYLFARFLHELGAGSPPAIEPILVERLCLYDWPLNVRELVTLVKRLLVIYGHEPMLGLRHLPARLRGEESAALGPASARAMRSGGPERGPPAVDGAERDDLDFRRLVDALRAHAGNVSRAAAAVGISRQRAYRLMQARPDLDLEVLRDGQGSREPRPS